MPNNASTKYGSIMSVLEAIHRYLTALRMELGPMTLEERNLPCYTTLGTGLRRRSATLTDNATTDSLATGA